MGSSRPTPGQVELLGAERPVVTTGSVTTGRAPSILGLALAAALAAGAVWWLVGGESEGSPPSEESATEDETAEGAATQDDTIRDEAPSTSTERSAELERVITPVEISDIGDIAPGSGMSLVLGGQRRWRVVNFDAGTVHEIDQRGDLVAAIDGFLIANTEGFLRALPLNDLSADPVILHEGQGPFVSESNTPGHVWVVDRQQLPADGTSFLLVEMETGTIVETRELPVRIWSLVLGFQAGQTIDVLTPSAGGVYAYNGTGYGWVLPGTVVAANEDIALIERCGNELNCSFDWHNARTWQTVDLPVPERNFDLATFVGGGRWLLLLSFFDQTAQIFEPSTGEIRELDESLLGDSNQPAFSSDGTWMASVGSGKLIVTEIETMQSVEVEGRWDGFWSLVFVDRPLP